jgi:Fe-Mn family superoxide dismutase
MKKLNLIGAWLCLIVIIVACSKKKLTEVVEVPLPTVNEKVAIGDPDDVSADAGPFELTKLKFSYEALLPYVDAMTMDIHYAKHYLSFTNNLNKIVDDTEMEDLTIEEILAKAIPDSTRLRNNAGGYYNHTLFFESIGPKSGGKPKDTLAQAIIKDFGTFENFKTQFKTVAYQQLGSGWAWLIVDKSGHLQVTSTSNQDNPLLPKATVSGIPILALDLWEHAYFLQYQFKKKNYIDSFFTIINWSKVSEKYEAAIEKNVNSIP